MSMLSLLIQQIIFYLTEIKKEYEGDTFFPEFEDKYEEVERTTDESGDMDFVKYKRK